MCGLGEWGGGGGLVDFFNKESILSGAGVVGGIFS